MFPDLCPFPWPVEGHPCLLFVCADLNGAAHCSSTFFLPWSHLLCFPAATGHIRGWDVSCHAEFGSLGLMCVQSVFMCACVYIRVCT